MKKTTGFTLIEILIALTVFAVLATITSSSLYYAFNTRSRVAIQALHLNNLQLAVSIMQQDITQIVNRAIRGDEMHLFPALVGQNQYLEFTRAGYTNPASREKRSTLKRVALVCEDKQLIHRTWSMLDTPQRDNYQDKVLLADIENCHFNYLNKNNQLLHDWRPQQNAGDPNAELVPRAIQINLNFKDWGEMNMLFIIPGGLYASA